LIRLQDQIKKIDALLLILIAIALNRCTDWLPEHCYIHPFPFYEIVDKFGNAVGITIQSYFFMICLHFFAIFYWNYTLKKTPNEKPLFWCFRGIEILSLFDFVLIYEKAFIHIGSFGLQFTDLKILFYATLYILWKAGKL
jgi:hypothetical protein